MIVDDNKLPLIEAQGLAPKSAYYTSEVIRPRIVRTDNYGGLFQRYNRVLRILSEGVNGKV
jgi:hypothetical protein